MIRTIAILLLLASALHAQTLEWTRVPGPYGGRVTRIIVAPWGTLYAATAGGIHRSDDSGRTWRFAGGPRLPVTEIAPGSRGLVFAAFGSGIPTILRSFDDGATWGSDYDLGIDAPDGINQRGFVVDTLEGRLYLAAGNRVLRRLIGGNAWIPYYSAVRPRDLIATEAGLIAVQTGSLVRMRTGVRDVLAANATITRVAVDQSGRIAFTGSIDGAGTLFATTPGKPFRSIDTDTTAIASMLALGPDGEITLGYSGGVIRRSTDSGATWRGMRLERAGASLEAVDLGGGTLVVADDEGILRSTDGGATFVESSAGIDARAITHLATRNGAPLYVGTASGAGFRSDDGARTFTRRRPTRIGTPAVADDGAVYAPFEFDLVVSRDRGLTWEIATAGGRNAQQASLRAVATRREHVYFLDDEGVIRHSSDRGVTWLRMRQGLNTSIFALRVDSSGAVMLLTEGGIDRTTDHGRTWHAMAAPAILRELAVAPDGTIHGVAADTLYSARSDGGWDAQVIEGSAGSVGPIAIDNAGGIILWTSGAGMLRSTDRGASWTRWDAAAFGSGVTSLAVADTTVFAGTASSGILRLDHPRAPNPSRVDDDRSSVVSGVTVAPNPVRERLSVTYEIVRAARVTIALHDAAGERVRQSTTERAAGRHATTIDASDLSAGAYVLSVGADGERVSRTVVVE